MSGEGWRRDDARYSSGRREEQLRTEESGVGDVAQSRRESGGAPQRGKVCRRRGDEVSFFFFLMTASEVFQRALPGDENLLRSNTRSVKAQLHERRHSESHSLIKLTNRSINQRATLTD